jgi:hypothetical protein
MMRRQQELKEAAGAGSSQFFQNRRYQSQIRGKFHTSVRCKTASLGSFVSEPSSVDSLGKRGVNVKRREPAKQDAVVYDPVSFSVLFSKLMRVMHART